MTQPERQLSSYLCVVLGMADKFLLNDAERIGLVNFVFQDDVLKNSFNVLRMLLKVYGPAKAPETLVSCHTLSLTWQMLCFKSWYEKKVHLMLPKLCI